MTLQDRQHWGARELVEPWGNKPRHLIEFGDEFVFCGDAWIKQHARLLRLRGRCCCHAVTNVWLPKG
jgi:hypothetical protein